MSDGCEVIQNSLTFQRKRIAILLLLGILFVFWIVSRYPALINEYTRASNGTLVEREVGVLSKDAMLATHNVTGPFDRLYTATIDWLDTNKIGMSFGFLFSAAILVLLEQSAKLRRSATRTGFRGVMSGLLLGMPLGVCTNCATPVALGLKKSGVSDDASFATLIASPSLNPIGLLMIYLIFPAQVWLIRLLIIMGFLFFILPFLTRRLGLQQPPLFEVETPDLQGGASESWQQSLYYCLGRFKHYLFFVVKQILPIMVLMGLLGVLLLVIFPLQNFLVGETLGSMDIVFAGIIGALLPVPMFVDIVMVFLFYSMGLPLSIVVTLLVTMAPISAFALYVMARNVNWKLSLAVGVIICCMGIMSGLTVQYLQEKSGVANVPTSNFDPFSVAKVVPPQAPFDEKSFQSFFGSGVSIVDYNNDGLDDIFLAGNAGARLFKNKGNMQFMDVTEQTKIAKDKDTMAGIWGDFNNDGWLDLYMVNYKDKKNQPQSNILYQNNGDGTFSDVTKKMHLFTNDLSSSAAWGDFDNDGDLDLFVSNYGEIWIKDGKDISGQSQKDRLYRNDGDKFIEVTATAGVGGTVQNTESLLNIDHGEIAGNRGYSFQPVWFDYDNDNLPDLFVTQDFGTSQLYKNLGNGLFRNMTQTLGLAIYGTSMGVAVTDLNQDGYWDLIVTTGEANQVWINDHGRKFKNQVDKYHLGDNHRFGWGVAPIDFDNKGEKAFFIVNGPTAKGGDLNSFQELMANVSSENLFYVPQKDHRYLNLNKKYHLYNQMVGRGLALGDLNQDGFVDMVITNRDDKAQMIVYKNNGQGANYLQIQLQGAKGINHQAVGTKVSVFINDQVQSQLLQAGSSFLSQHSSILTFGLGAAKQVDKVEILWPDGKRQTLKNLVVNQKVTISYQSVKQEKDQKKNR